MNKLMIALGLLLIAGLSFAWLPPTSWQYEWQNYVSYRYNCQLEQVSTGQYGLANYMYAYAQPYIPYSQLYSMGLLLSYPNGMLTHIRGGGGSSGMAYDYYVPPFMADMNGYNTDSMAFRAIFNSVLRTYLAHGGDRAYVFGMLNSFNTNYMSCAAQGRWPPVPQS